MKFIKLLLFSLTFINLNSSDNLHSRRNNKDLTEIDICYKYLAPDFFTLMGCEKAIQTNVIKFRLKTKLNFKELKTTVVTRLFKNPLEKGIKLTFKFFKHNLNNVNCMTYDNDNDLIDLEDYDYIEVIHPEVEERLRSK